MPKNKKTFNTHVNVPAHVRTFTHWANITHQIQRKERYVCLLCILISDINYTMTTPLLTIVNADQFETRSSDSFS